MIITQPQSEQEFIQYYHFRWQILRQPWQQAEGSEKDRHENDAIHVMALEEDTNRTLLGVARLHAIDTETAQIRFMAIAASHRRRGIGSNLIRYLEQQAARSGKKTIILNARHDSLAFYRAHGYHVLGPAHTLYGEIEHCEMKKILD